MSLTLRAAAVVGAAEELAPPVAAREAWPAIDPRFGEQRVQLIATDVRAAWPEAPDRIARMDRLTRLSLLAVHRLHGAFGESAPFETTRDEPVGISFASALATLGTNETFDRRYHAREARSGRALGDAHLFPYTAPNAAAGEIGIAFALHGPVVVRIGGGCSDMRAFCVADVEPSVRRWVIVVADVLSPAAIAWLASNAIVRDGDVASEGAVAFLIDSTDSTDASARGPRIVRADGGIDAPDVARATLRDPEGRVRYGTAGAIALAASFLGATSCRGTWESRAPSGAWARIELA